MGTVYRNLEVLTRDGTIRKLDLGGPEARFDGDLAPHCHVRCVRCERVDDVHDAPDDLTTHEFGALDGYDILGYKVAFFGICPACRRQQGSEEATDSIHGMRT